MRAVLRAGGDVVSGALAGVFLVADLLGLSQLTASGRSIDLRVLALLFLGAAAAIVTYRVYELRAALDDRAERRAVADQLARFMYTGVAHQSSIVNMPGGGDVTRKDLQEWRDQIKDYLWGEPLCGDSYAARFLHDNQTATTQVSGAGIVFSNNEQLQLWRNYTAALNTLREFVEEFTN